LQQQGRQGSRGATGRGDHPPIHHPQNFKRMNTENVQNKTIFAQFLVIFGGEFSGFPQCWNDRQ